MTISTYEKHTFGTRIREMLIYASERWMSRQLYLTLKSKEHFGIDFDSWKNWRKDGIREHDFLFLLDAKYGKIFWDENNPEELLWSEKTELILLKIFPKWLQEHVRFVNNSHSELLKWCIQKDYIERLLRDTGYTRLKVGQKAEVTWWKYYMYPIGRFLENKYVFWFVTGGSLLYLAHALGGKN